MFSGIIEFKKKTRDIKKTKDGLRMTFPIPVGLKISLGESLNIDGVCSTVESLNGKSFGVFYMPETLKKSTFGVISEKHEFNLEKSLTLNSLVGGHLVSGHTDTTAEVVKIEKESESRLITFKLFSKFTTYIVYKGSICVNGVSLTVVDVTKDTFTVSLIPHTLRVTNLGKLQEGDKVNVEVDLIAKYLEKLTVGI